MVPAVLNYKTNPSHISTGTETPKYPEIFPKVFKNHH